MSSFTTKEVVVCVTEELICKTEAHRFLGYASIGYALFSESLFSRKVADFEGSVVFLFKALRESVQWLRAPLPL